MEVRRSKKFLKKVSVLANLGIKVNAVLGTLAQTLLFIMDEIRTKIKKKPVLGRNFHFKVPLRSSFVLFFKEFPVVF